MQEVGRTGGPVLVVDDDWRVREVVGLALEECGFSVKTAADGDKAITLARIERPGVLVLDLTLSGTDGFAVAAAVRQMHGESVPIVVVTADGNPGEKVDQIRAVAYLSKPFDIDDLTALVGRALAGS
jgi:two-component system alkaline phosphatase synthesis response regulator PhoP